MSNNEAKFLLNAYRANGADAAEPTFQPALTQAKSDPALGAWFAREQAHSAAVGAKLREIAPPVGLRDAILAGGRATASAPRSSTRLNAGQWLALAASIALLLGVGYILFPRSNSLTTAALTAFAMDDVRHGRHGAHGAAEKALQVRLGQTDHIAETLPVTYEEMESSGCRSLNIAGHEVLEICFARNGVEFHCYLARASEFAGAGGSAGAPQFSTDGPLVAANWVSRGFRYVLVTDAGIEALKRLL
jgi:hypothetical protein